MIFSLYLDVLLFAMLKKFHRREEEVGRGMWVRVDYDLFINLTVLNTLY